MFQPAEEDGSGAEKVHNDPRFPEIAPDYALALHNFPGVPSGHAVIAPGPMNCASRGMKITLEGRTAHASQPGKGRSRAAALSLLIRDLVSLAFGDDAAHPNFALVTVTHARLGEPAFGIAPGKSEFWVTLRSQENAFMDDSIAWAEDLVAGTAMNAHLAHSVSYHDVFHQCENDPEASDILKAALQAEHVPLAETELPMRGSEDFGRFRIC